MLIRVRQEAISDIFFYNEEFYNRTRSHCALAFLNSADSEVGSVMFLIELLLSVKMGVSRSHFSASLGDIAQFFDQI
jgi:hypothetical protein